VNFTATTTTTINHSVLLTWNASTSPSISGYNLYRGTVSGGPYTKITGSLVPSTSYVDNSVTSGQTYFYVATTVANSMESSYSTEVTAVVPTP
jgi:fibronectin type 3 domain-containing protein